MDDIYLRITASNTSAKIRMQLPENGREFFYVKTDKFPIFEVRTSRTVKIFKAKSGKAMSSCTRADRDTVQIYTIPPKEEDETYDDDEKNSFFSYSYDGVSGMTKQLINDMARRNAGMIIEWLDMTQQDVDNYRVHGRDIVEIDENEQAGADIAKASAATAVIASGIMMLTSKGKAAFKDPDTLKTVRDSFTGVLKKEKVEMTDVPVKELDYKKRSKEDRVQLDKDAPKAKSKFNKSLVDSPEKITKLKKKGFTDKDITKMKKGRPADGYQAHHKLPLDDGGTNDMSNFALTKQDPYHKTFTATQKTLTKGMKPGDSKIVEFPVPKGNLYPPTK